jgi:DNA-binding NtrC family response regulator
LATYLVVDDSPTIRLTLAAAIRHASGGMVKVLEAADANSAIDTFLRDKPSVVFLDMMLGGGPTGLDALNVMLRERPEARVVLVTALPGDHPEVLAAISLGAFAHLGKPVRTDDVKRVLQTIEGEEGRLGRIR